MSRSKKPEKALKSGTNRREKVFHDSTNTIETFRKDAPRLNAATLQFDQPKIKKQPQHKTDQQHLKYADFATPKVDNRNKDRLRHQEDVESRSDLQHQIGAFRNQLFEGTESSRQKRSENCNQISKADHPTTTMRNISPVQPFQNNQLPKIVAHQCVDSKKSVEQTSRPLNVDRPRRDLPATKNKRDRDMDMSKVHERKKDGRVKDELSNEKSPSHQENTAFEHILRDQDQKPPADVIGRPGTLQQLVQSQVDDAAVLRAMLESCRRVDGSGQANRMERDKQDQLSAQIVSLSTSFGVKTIDTSQVCAASVDGSDLTLMSSDDEDEEQLELPPGWKQVMSRSKNKPYYIHPDHGRTWYCPTLIHSRKRRKLIERLNKNSDHPGMLPSNGKMERNSAKISIMKSRCSETNDDSSDDGPNFYPTNTDVTSNSRTSSDNISSRVLLQTDDYARDFRNSQSVSSHTQCLSYNRTNNNEDQVYQEQTIRYGHIGCDNKTDRNGSFENLEHVGDTIDTSMDTSGTDDDYHFDADFDQSNESPLHKEAMSPNQDECAPVHNSATSEEGIFDDLSSENEDESLRWISYPSVPRCSLQYLHELLQRQHIDT
jgi:hypothetical protein